MTDLTSVEGVEHYLSQTPYAASSVIPLSGGNANFTYRIILQRPYNIGSGVQIETMVLKHAEPYVATIKDIPFATERQNYESMALKQAQRLTHPWTIVSVPTLYYHDREHCVMLMSDSGFASTTLKALFQTAPPDIEDSRIIGNSLGTFLARLHKTTYTSVGSSSIIKKFFEKNQQARKIVGQLTYGSLINTVAPEHIESSLIDPPLNLSSTELTTLADLAMVMQERILTSNEVLAMGDFWPGNILVSFTPELHLNVVDWEAARPGIAGIEIGQFVAEMHSLSTFHPSCLPSVDAVVSSFLMAYSDIALQDRTAQEVLDVAWTAATHYGTHLVTSTPRVSWGTKERTREVVLEGVDCLLRVADRDEAWLRTSIIQNIFS